jgi:cellulose synthase/poly-beta-1,6-N-acetylglucosamine synthase-like glycosyltransferase
MNESANTMDGAALSPPFSGETLRRRSRSHRYKFCFIIPAYAGKRNANGERQTAGVLNLARCIDSVAQQTDPDCRIIVVNDGNSVEMRDLIQNMQKAIPGIPITYYQAPYRGERGGHESVNLALSVLPDDVQFVTILNGDNVLRPTYIEDMYYPEYDIVTCMVKMNDLPGIVLDGRTFSRRSVDRLNYTIRADIAVNTKHKMHIDADCDFVIDCLAMAENGVYYVEKILAEHN